MGASDARVIHQRPALIQELDWRPRGPRSPTTRYCTGSSPRGGVDLLQRPVVPNHHHLRSVENRRHDERGRDRGSVGDIPSRWVRGDRTLTLSRNVFLVAFQLVMMSTTLNDLAEASVPEAVSPDDADAALQREANRRKRELADAIAAQDRAHTTEQGRVPPLRQHWTRRGISGMSISEHRELRTGSILDRHRFPES